MNEPKQLFETLNKLTGNISEKIYPKKFDEKTTSDEMAQYYIDKISKIRSELNNKNTTNISEESDISASTCFSHFLPTDPEELKSIISSMKTKTCMLDPIPTSILKKIIEHLLPVIVHIINSSISNNTFPNLLKQARVTSRIKDRQKIHDDYANFRPLNELPFLSKTLERVMYLQLNSYIEKINYTVNFSLHTEKTSHAKPQL